MASIDILLAIPLVWGAFMGFKKGLILELASMLALALGTYGSIQFSDSTARFLNEELAWTSEWLGLIAFLITFLAIVFAVFLLGRILDKMLKIIALGLVNRIVGMLFGLLKYALLLSVLLFFFENLNNQFRIAASDWHKESILFEPLQSLLYPVKPLLNEIRLDNLDVNLPELP